MQTLWAIDVKSKTSIYLFWPLATCCFLSRTTVTTAVFFSPSVEFMSILLQSGLNPQATSNAGHTLAPCLFRMDWEWLKIRKLGGGFNRICFIFTPRFGEMIQFDYSNIFQIGWNQQLEKIHQESSTCIQWFSCFCWWRCTPGPTFVFGRLERNCCCCAVVLLNESLAVCSLSAFLVEVTWDAWPKDIWVCWLLHSQHVSEDILQWSIHGRYYTDDIHTYQQISSLFGLKMQGPLADVGEHIYCQRFQGSWFGSKAPEQEDSSR